MDFSGRGYITQDDFISSIFISRILQAKIFTIEDIKDFLKQDNLFPPSTALSSGGLSFDKFKKMFFPKMFLINDSEESDDEKINKMNKQSLKVGGSDDKDSEAQSILAERLKKMEKLLKEKFSNNWESVRKAFLALDSDHDGYITVEDILRHFGQEKSLVNYNDLKKIIVDKDSKKRGMIGYTDFSKWVGNAIHMSEGFYFRHDSVKNPQFESVLALNDSKCTEKTKALAS
jgi:Ca2+-binding EF-hand superfamily protein